MAATRMQTVSGAVKRLAGITVTDLHSMGIREVNKVIKTLPIVMAQVEGELTRRNSKKIPEIS